MTVLAAATVFAPALFSAPEAVGGRQLSKTEVRRLIASAKTRADHERIAKYFDAEADKFAAESNKHEELAELYRKTGPNSAKYPGGVQTFNHCDSLAKSLERASEQARQLANDHWEMAKEASR